MISNHEMIEIFGEKNLVYVRPESLHGINLPEETREFILNTGFPHVVGYFRFSMDFEPISEDIQIGESVNYLGQLFTIGCIGTTQLVGRVVQLSKIGLDKTASLSDIDTRIKALGIDDVIFSSEVMLSQRICFNLENNGEITYIAPSNLSISFLNSSIQKLAASIAAYWRNLSSGNDFVAGLEKFEKELNAIDPKALDSQENAWVKLLERLIRDEEGY